LLGDPRLARVAYALFAVAILAALLKQGGITGAKPAVLQMAPAEPAAAVAEPAPEPIESRVPDGPLLDWPEEDDVRPLSDFEMGGRLEGRAEPAKLAPDASVFRRPSSGGGPSEPVCGDLGAFPESSRVVFPLPGEYLGSYEAGWGSPRPQGGHEGTDLMSPAGTPEFAVTDGTIVEVAGANENGWNRLGGYTVMLEAAYDVGPIRADDLFYYAHLDERSTLPIGAEVRAGQQVGVVGDTGEGPEGTRGEFSSHLHLGWYDAGEAGARSEAESGAMDPYPLLLWLESNGGAVSGGTDASYCEAPQGPVPATDSPGERPDMDTGDGGDARPSPVVEDNERRERPSDEESGKEGDGRASEPGPNGAETVVVTVVAPGEPEDAPHRTVQPVEGGETRGGIGDTEEPSPETPPDFDRSPLPVPDAPGETTKPDDLEGEEGAEKDRDAPKAGDTKRDEEGESSEHPDAEVPEDRPESGSAGEPEELQPASGEEKPSDEVHEEDPEADPEPSAGEDTVPAEPGDSTTVVPGEADGEG
jgi:murein DD-endopeptidase MepM/ murein hydrolase activator NlpD